MKSITVHVCITLQTQFFVPLYEDGYGNLIFSSLTFTIKMTTHVH